MTRDISSGTIFLSAAALLLAAGCGGGDVGRVSGKVTLGGHPAVGTSSTVTAINRPGQHVCRCPSRWTSLAFPQAAIDGIRRSFTSREAEIRLHVLRRTREPGNEAVSHPLARAERIGALIPGCRGHSTPTRAPVRGAFLTDPFSTTRRIHD